MFFGLSWNQFATSIRGSDTWMVVLIAILFIAFFWFGLGSKAYAINVLPLAYLAFNVERFITFNAIFVSLLAAVLLSTFLSLLSRLPDIILFRRFFLNGKKFMMTILAMVILLGLIANYPIYSRLTPPSEACLNAYSTNEEIPKDITSYFKTTNESGRILAIMSPEWILVLPMLFPHVSLVDGWNPIARIPPVLNKYTISRIYAQYPEEKNIDFGDVWDYYLGQSSNLDIAWVLIGKWSSAPIAQELMRKYETQFELVLDLPEKDLRLYHTRKVHEMIDILSGTAELVNYQRPSPDTIIVQIRGAKTPLRILVKETYYPKWEVFTDLGEDANLARHESGLMEIQIYLNGDIQVTLQFTHTAIDLAGYLASLAAILMLLFFVFIWGRRNG
jgi:hypothetical protein